MNIPYCIVFHVMYYEENSLMKYLAPLFCSELNYRKPQTNGLLELSCQVFTISAGITHWMFGLLVSLSLQKWEGEKHSTWVLIWSANLRIKLLHLMLKFCVSCNICVFVRYLKHPFITVLQQRPAWQLCLNAVQNKGDRKALFHL